MKRESCRPRSMVSMAQEFLDILFWKLHRILDQEGVSVLQWAIMQRALEHDRGVAFSLILKATRCVSGIAFCQGRFSGSQGWCSIWGAQAVIPLVAYSKLSVPFSVRRSAMSG